jgi:hypothetical protein
MYLRRTSGHSCLKESMIQGRAMTQKREGKYLEYPWSPEINLLLSSLSTTILVLTFQTKSSLSQHHIKINSVVKTLEALASMLMSIVIIDNKMTLLIKTPLSKIWKFRTRILMGQIILKLDKLSRLTSLDKTWLEEKSIRKTKICKDINSTAKFYL